MRVRVNLWYLALAGLFGLPLKAQDSPPIERASYTAATAGDTALAVDAVLAFTRPARGEMAVRLFPDRYPLIGELPRNADARVVLRDGAYWLLVQPGGGWPFPRARPGEARLSFRVPVSSGRDGRRCVMPIPPAMKATLDLPGEFHELNAVPPAPTERVDGRYRLHVPPCKEVAIAWRAAPPAAAAAGVFRADADASVSVGTSALTADTDLTIEVLQGELGAITLLVPEGGQLRALSGKQVSRWELKDGKARVELRSPLRGSAKLSVRTEALAEKLGALVWFPVAVEGAQHQGGRAYFRAEPGLLLRMGDRQGFERLSDGYAGDEAAGRQTLVLAYPRLPASVRLMVEPLPTHLSAAVAVLARLERGVVTQQATVDYTVHDAPVRQLKVNVGSGADLLSVECPGLLDTEVEGGVLTARLREAVKDKMQLKLTVQRPLERVDGVVIPRLLAAGVERQTGMVGVAASADVELRHRHAVEAEQIDVKLLPEWVRQAGAKLAYRYFDRPNSQVAVETAPLEAEFDTVATETCTLGEEGWTRRVVWQCSVHRGEVFAFRVRMPEGVTPIEAAVKPGPEEKPEQPKPAEKSAAPPPPLLRDWEFDAADRLLKVALTRGAKGRLELSARFTQRVPEAATSLLLLGLTLDGVRRHTGELAVEAAQKAVSLRATDARSLEARRGTEGQLAFAQDAAAWRLELAATPIEPVVSVEALTLLGVRPGQITADALLAFSIEKAPVNTLTLRLPEGAVNSSVRGADIRTSRLDKQVWTVRLAQKVKGPYILRVTYDHVTPAEGGTCACGTIETPAAARHEGFVLVARESDRIEVAAEAAEGLFAAEPGDALGRANVPGDFRSAAPRVVAAYRYTGRGALRARIAALGRAEVLQAKALAAIVETMLKEDGQAITHLTYDIRSAGRQFLRVELPQGAALLGAYVNGRPVPSSTDPDGSTLVPLLGGQRPTSMRGGDEVIEVNVVYAQWVDELAGGRTLKLVSPPVDVRTEALSWAVYLPQGYRAHRTDGNMRLLFRPPSDRLGGIVSGMFAEEADALGVAWRAIGSALDAAWAFILDYGTTVLIVLGVAIAVFLIGRKAGHIVGAIQEHRERARTRRVERQPRSALRTVGVAVVAVAVVIVLAGMFLPVLSRAREEARRIRARNNLNQIAKGMATYLNECGDNRFYPNTLRAFRNSRIIPDPGVFVDPETNRPFVYLHDGKNIRDDFPPNEPLGYMEGSGGVNVLFADSHVEYHAYGSPKLAQIIPSRDFSRPPADLDVRAARGTPTPGAPAEMPLALDMPVSKDHNEVAQLEEDMEGEKLDYGQQRLLGRIKDRSGRKLGGRDSLALRTEPVAKEEPKSEEPGPEMPAPGKPRPLRPPGKTVERRPHGREAKPTTATTPAGQPPEEPTTTYAGMGVAKHRYSPVRGGRQKGALPIEFELPSEGVLPYIFHRPVTGGALGEVELDCCRLGASTPAKAVLWLGILGFVALAGLGAVSRVKAARRKARRAGEAPTSG